MLTLDEWKRYARRADEIRGTLNMLFWEDPVGMTAAWSRPISCNGSLKERIRPNDPEHASKAVSMLDVLNRAIAYGQFIFVLHDWGFALAPAWPETTPDEPVWPGFFIDESHRPEKYSSMTLLKKHDYDFEVWMMDQGHRPWPADGEQESPSCGNEFVGEFLSEHPEYEKYSEQLTQHAGKLEVEVCRGE